MKRAQLHPARVWNAGCTLEGF